MVAICLLNFLASTCYLFIELFTIFALQLNYSDISNGSMSYELFIDLFTILHCS